MIAEIKSLMTERLDLCGLMVVLLIIILLAAHQQAQANPTKQARYEARETQTGRARQQAQKPDVSSEPVEEATQNA